ncbi:MAG: GDP-mannose 4,6-dehydratase [Ardenticatenia bacterium]|nr:GDP-mannose 4,6-dehydratase [Ardenticatenia bacterium]
MRALITGIGGFAGSFLAEHLLEQGYEVWGVVRRGPGHVAHLQAHVKLIRADVTDLEHMCAVLEDVRPQRIYHLAAQSFVPRSWEDPWGTFETNVRGQLNVLQAVCRADLPTRVLVVGSNEAYGRVSDHELPIREETPFRPETPYGVSKVAQELLGLHYWLSRHVYTVRVRPFNHIGPRQSARFVAAAFARQVAEAEANLRPPLLRVGNLTARRDFSDVRDVVRAYHLLLEHGTPGDVYNVGRGRAYSIQHVLDTLLGFSQVTFRVEQDPARLRPSDVPISYADISKIRAAVGWEPHIPFEQSLHDVLEYWRAQVRRPDYQPGEPP